MSMKNLLLVICAIVVSNMANAQIIRLSSYEYDIYPCAHPKHGFIKTNFSIRHESCSDSFVINLNNNTFTWKDYKGSSKNDIYQVSREGDVITFITAYNSVKIIIGKSIDIIFWGDDNNSYMLAYKCHPN